MTLRAPLDRYPGMNRLVLDWLAGDERFLRRGTMSSPQRRETSSRRADVAAAIAASNRRWGIFADEALDRWSRNQTLTVIAGQQVGFAGGPLYTLAKIATLIRLKRDLETQGIEVTPFFWLATEDHDYEEVASLNVPVSTLATEKDVNRQLDLLCIRAVRTTESRTVVGSLAVPESLVSQLLSLYDMPRPSWLREGITFGDSFAELVATAFGGEVILIDSLLPELRRAGAPLFEQINRREGEIQAALSERADDLTRAGYAEQVVPRDGERYTLLFEVDARGHRRQPQGEIAPERTSTSALTRPLLQDFVLEPDIFIGGPAEVAYYAQLAPLHELLGVSMPRVALRGHALVAPRRVARTMERHAIDPADVFSLPERILAQKEPEAVTTIRRTSDEAKRDLFRRIGEISDVALPADRSLAGSFERSVGHIEYHFEKLAERAIKAVARRNRERYEATRDVVATLYPDRHVQDRVTGWYPWWCVYGRELVERVIEEIQPDTSHFTIVEL